VKAEAAEPSRQEALVFVGRISREKGMLLLAEAARRTQMPLVIIGDGDEGLKNTVRQINPGAEFTGWLPQSAIVERLRKCRALVMPSLWYETLGLVAVEAMAQGIPVIVPDQCAIKDYVRDGTTGLLFSQGSVDDLCLQINRLKDAALAAKIGRAAYDWYWSDPWTIERHVDSLQEFYGEVLREDRFS
jgi:glycosyltransferase involved in cell wall biosynthesis